MKKKKRNKAESLENLFDEKILKERKNDEILSENEAYILLCSKNKGV